MTQLIHERIDKAFINTEWNVLFRENTFRPLSNYALFGSRAYYQTYSALQISTHMAFLLGFRRGSE